MPGVSTTVLVSFLTTPELEFFAGMQWRLIRDGREGYGPYRVLTLAYDYSLTVDSAELWAMHWQPAGESWEKRPHLHLGEVILSGASPINRKAHLLTGRMTFENAIRWCIDFGAIPLHDDWNDRLALSEAPHLLNRTWHVNPTPPGC